MIKIEHVITPSPEQMMFVIEGARNPLNSWDKTDSQYLETADFDPDDYNGFKLGPSDERLMRRLCQAGPDERKFMRMMQIGMRITAPMYWWKEFDTYKVATVRNSCSTMHKVMSKPFELSDFSYDYLKDESYVHMIEGIVYDLNTLRDLYFHIDTKYKKEVWYRVIQLLPSSYNQTANVTFNYETARNMYFARKGHKLDEWSIRNPDSLCSNLERLPYAFLITEEEPFVEMREKEEK